VKDIKLANEPPLVDMSATVMLPEGNEDPFIVFKYIRISLAPAATLILVFKISVPRFHD
jgi:hypothetical protein